MEIRIINGQIWKRQGGEPDWWSELAHLIVARDEGLLPLLNREELLMLLSGLDEEELQNILAQFGPEENQ